MEADIQKRNCVILVPVEAVGKVQFHIDYDK